jgi:hypothetical protein
MGCGLPLPFFWAEFLTSPIMARKTSKTAHQQWKKAEYDIWRLLIRNPKFQKELLALGRRCRKPRIPSDRRQEKGSSFPNEMDETRKFCDKWGLVRLPCPPGFLSLAYDIFAPHEMELAFSRRQELAGPDPVVVRRPAEILELQKDRFLYCWVDVTWPIDLVLATFEGQLREFYQDRKASRKKRRRPDNLDMQLRVFDEVTKIKESGGEINFSILAKQFRIHASTIRTMYYAACHKIGIQDGHKGNKIKDPGPFNKCSDPRCRAAQRENNLDKALSMLCPRHKNFLGKYESKSTRETLRDPALIDCQVTPSQSRKASLSSAFS